MIRHLKFYLSTLLLSASLVIFGQVNNLEQLALEYYHLKLAEELKVPSKELKLYPGVSTAGSSSMWLWNIFNAISHSPGIFYNPAQANNFSQEYVQLLYDVNVQQAGDTCSLQEAITKYSKANVKAWDVTIDDLHYLLAESDSLVFKSDTVIYYYQEGSTEKQEASITVSVCFQKALVFYAYPYSFQNTNSPVLKKYEPWFTPCFLRSAYDNVDYHYLTEQKWERLFDSDGVMRNICVALIIVKNGISKINASNNSVNFQTNTKIESSVLLGVVISPIKKFVVWE